MDESDLSLHIDVELQYIGDASADNQGKLFGVTYVLDFEDFDAHADAINEPGTCQNRNGDDFTGSGQTFDDFWDYSNQPVIDIGTPSFLAYPPADPIDGDWEISMGDQCNTIVYNGKFTWSDLRNCQKYGGGDSYTSVVSDDNWLNLTGTFYINLVSPYWYDADYGFYRVYQLISQPFVIAVSSVVNVLGSTDINLMTMSIIAVYKEDEGPDDEKDMYADFKLVVLTECSDYMKLTREPQNGIDVLEFDGSDFSNDQVQTSDFTVSLNTENDGCLSNKGFICSQLWQISAIDIACTNEVGRDFSGKYSLTFTPECRDDIDSELNAHCDEFLLSHPQLTSDDRVALSTNLVWKDEICDPIIFTVQFEAIMSFYDNDQFDDPVDNSHLYQVGEDTIYVQVYTTFPDDTMDVFDTKLIEVHICTFDPLVDVFTNFNNPQDLENFGCFVAGTDGRDEDYDQYFHLIFQDNPIDSSNPIVSLFDFAQYPESISNIVRFSFTVPNEVARDQLYVQAEIEVELEELGRRRRRRMLLNVNPSTANQMQNFIEQIGINHGEETIINKEPKQEPRNYNPPQQYYPPQQPVSPVSPVSNPSSYTINLSSPWIIGLGGLLSVILTFNIIFMTYKHCCCNNNDLSSGRASFMKRKKGYSKVDVESEFDSEAQMIGNDDDEQ